jgi:hypothetical protein
MLSLNDPLCCFRCLDLLKLLWFGLISNLAEELSNIKTRPKLDDDE